MPRRKWMPQNETPQSHVQESKKRKTASSKKYPGAHVSSAGGVHNAVENALAVNARSFAMFLKSQRQWKSKPLEEEVIEKFKSAKKEARFDDRMILPHGSYLLNLGAPNKDTLMKSREAFLDELQRCELLGLTMLNIHPGSTCGKITREECIANIAESINQAHAETRTVKVVLENMSKQGNTIGGDLNELKEIIDKVKDKSRMGICIDTCHAMAAGYDLSTENGFSELKDDIRNIIGADYLCGIHMNDSKGVAGCHLDRHENIGKGKIGLEGFRRLMNDSLFDDLPLILETPVTDAGYGKEIQILDKLQD